MKKIFTLIILLSINTSFSQKNISGEITYKKTIEFPKPKIKTLNYEKELKSIRNSLDKLKYKLKFNGTSSYFDIKKSMDLDIENLHRKAISKGKGEETFYTNLVTNTCIEINKLGGETFLISNLKPKFKLTNETKIINGYTCYKATASETVYFSKLNIGMEDTVNDVVAWYATKIPSQFGPLNFFGLPGLILELQFSNVTYTAVDLKFSNNNIKVPKPAKGKKVTSEEFEDLMIKTMKEMNVGLN